MTLPWDDDGRRILPSTLYSAYTDAMREFKRIDQKLRLDFLAVYPRLVSEARQRLGTMYDPADFPDVTVIPTKFDIKIAFEQIPDAKDFRVAVSDEAAELIREQISAENDLKFQAAMKDCFLSLIHISEPTRRTERSRMPSSA